MVLPVFAHPGPQSALDNADIRCDLGDRTAEGITSSTASSLYFWLCLFRSVVRRMAPIKLSHKTIRPQSSPNCPRQGYHAL